MNKLDQLLLHPKTDLQIRHFLKSPPQALLISGGFGSGKETLVKALSSELVELGDDKEIDSYPYFIHVRRLKNKSDISIEQIRGVIDTLKLKVPGEKNIKRIVFIEDAHLLSVPAQNALLKALEEPSQDTVFILSATSVHNVLPTIASRTQKIEMLPVNLDSAVEFWGKSHSEPMIKSAWQLSGGSAGLMHALLTQDKDHELKKAVDEAKNFLRANTYQRLLMSDKICRNKEQFQLFLDALSRTLSVLHHQAIQNERNKQANALLTSRKQLKKVIGSLQANGNSRLAALTLVLSFKV